MNLKLYIIIVTLLLALSSFGQSTNKWNAHAGLNYSSVSSKNSINPDGILGLNAGIGYKLYLDELGWALMPEVNYSQEGYYSQRLHYLHVPLSVGFDFTDNFNLSVGFQYSQLVGASNEATAVFASNNLAFLLSFEFFPTQRFVTGLRFSNGIKNIIEQPDLVVVQSASTYAIQFYVGVTLFKKKQINDAFGHITN